LSTNLGPHLPDALVDFFAGNDLPARLGHACLLVTQGADTFPHPAFVTAGELVAGDPDTLRVALYANSSASRNLRERPALAICLALEECAYYVKAEAEPFELHDPAVEGLAVFTIRPRHVLRDAEEGAEVTSGFRYRDLRGDEAVLAQWRPIVAALRDSFAPSVGTTP
jgi:hypothetical protein